MKVLLVCVSLFVFASGKKHHGPKVAHSYKTGNHALNMIAPKVSPITGVDLRQCFKTLLLNFDFNTPATEADMTKAFSALCNGTGEAQAILNFASTHQKPLATVQQLYESLTADEKTQIAANQTKDDVQGIIAFFRAKLVASPAGDKILNKTIEAVLKPYVMTNLKSVVSALNISPEDKKKFRRDLTSNSAAAIQFLKDKLAAANLKPTDANYVLVQTFIDQLSAF